MADGEQEQVLQDISAPDVVTKFQTAATIVNDALAAVKADCKPGARVVDLCNKGDKIIVDRTAKVYNKGKIEKGIAFPTCVSVNNVAGHFSPLSDDATELKAGDLVKIDLGAHIDGYPAQAAETFVVREDSSAPVTGRAADLIMAAHTAGEAVHRMLRPGTKNEDITDMIARVCSAYGVNPVEGVLSHSIKRYIIAGNEVIMNKSTVEQRADEHALEEHEVYTIDIVISTGEGKVIQKEERTTVYKRMAEVQYALKMKAARAALSEITTKFQSFPFTVRALEDEKKARLGVTECEKHDLLVPYPVLFEKDGELVAQVKFTALILPTSTIRMSNFSPENVQSDKKVEDEEVLKVLSTSTKKKKKKNKKSKGDASGAAAQ